METLDIYTIEDGIESVIIHDVRPFPLPSHNAPMTDVSRARHMYVPTIMHHFPIASACDVVTKMTLSCTPQCYVGRPDNPSFSMSNFSPFKSCLNNDRPVVGSEPLDALAARIWLSVGPSGRNKVHTLRLLSRLIPDHDPVTQNMLSHGMQDYLYQLAESVRALAPASHDSHLFALEASVCLFV